jgi:signal transduction histidine kinase
MNPIVVFILVQIAWFCLLGLWIYWYVANYITFTEISERVLPQIELNTQNIAALTGGLILLVGMSVGIVLLFERLRRQVRVTRMYDSFIANVTHELKSPLASITLHLETLRTRDLPQEQRDAFLDLMLRDAERFDRLVSSILEITGLEERRSVMDMQPYRAGELLRRSAGDAARQFGIDDDRFLIEGDADCTVLADERSVKIAVDNLIDNALKYSPNGSTIRVSIGCNARFASFAVTDEGVGIAPRDQKLVFRKFFRLGDPNSPNVKGTGLGLYWVREIIRHHKGRVGVESAGRGKGSTFRFELPVAPRGLVLRSADE